VGEFIESAAYFTKCIEDDPYESFYYLNRGDCYEKMGY